MRKVDVSREFSRYLGGRYQSDGSFSGEDFRKSILIPMVEKSLEDQEVININFDGVAGIPTSFLEEAFGGLIREKKEVSVEKIISILKVDAPRTPSLWPFIRLASRFMEEAGKNR